MWLEPDFSGILPELKSLPNWVLAKAVLREGKWTKPPFQPNGKSASHSDPSTWSSFDTVKSAYERGGYIGVGFVLDGQPHFGGKYLIGFDWDHCILDRRTDPEVLATIKTLRIPRIEISISGTGIRGFFLSESLLPSQRTHIDGRSVELYSNKRYMTTTGIGRGALL
jgi:primase-polymerase (primpol)-like protein